jgi:hypothetical protein
VGYRRLALPNQRLRLTGAAILVLRSVNFSPGDAGTFAGAFDGKAAWSYGSEYICCSS